MRNRDVLKCVMVCSMAWVLAVGGAVASSAGPRSAMESEGSEKGRASVRGEGGEGAVRLAETLMESLVEGVEVPVAALSLFEALYQRHKREIEQFIQDNPYVLWESLDVLADSLPGLKKLGEMEGRLYIPERAFAKASRLVDDIASKLSAPLSRDLTRTRNLVQSLFQESEDGQMMIDLNELARRSFN